MPTPPPVARYGAAALVASGLFFLTYDAVRPWRDETTLAGAAEAMSSPWWIVSHVSAMVGFITLALGLFALASAVRTTCGAGAARLAAVTASVGSGLTLPYYGAETFGLHAVATAVERGEPGDLLATAEAVRFQPVAVTTFGAGLLLLATATVLAAVAFHRAGVPGVARAAGVPLAVGFVLFLPQFFAPAPVRIAHGILLAVAALWFALGLRSVAFTAREADSAQGYEAFSHNPTRLPSGSLK